MHACMHACMHASGARAQSAGRWPSCTEGTRNVQESWKMIDRCACMHEWRTECRKEAMMSRLRSQSLNMPSSLLVKAAPHSALSLVSMPFSASALALRPSSSRFARSFL